MKNVGKTSRQTPDEHDLLALLHEMPKAIRSSWSWAARKISSRDSATCSPTAGIHMSRAVGSFSTWCSIRLLRWTRAYVVGYYKERGSQDPFVLDYLAEAQARVAGE